MILDLGAGRDADETRPSFSRSQPPLAIRARDRFSCLSNWASATLGQTPASRRAATRAARMTPSPVAGSSVLHDPPCSCASLVHPPRVAKPRHDHFGAKRTATRRRCSHHGRCLAARHSAATAALRACPPGIEERTRTRPIWPSTSSCTAESSPEASSGSVLRAGFLTPNADFRVEGFDWRRLARLSQLMCETPCRAGFRVGGRVVVDAEWGLSR